MTARTALRTHSQPSRTPSEEVEQFLAKVQKIPGGCWTWTGGLDSNHGYGRTYIRKGLYVYAHRRAYELLVGPIPDGLEIDHVKKNGCTTTACVKAIADEYGPAHLEAVTPQVNNQRGNSLTAINARKTHCQNGHLFNEENTLVTAQSRRLCRICEQSRRTLYRQSRRTDVSALKQTGLCQHCGRLYTLRKDGRVRSHTVKRPYQFLSGPVVDIPEPCPGSFMQPRTVRQ